MDMTKPISTVTSAAMTMTPTSTNVAVETAAAMTMDMGGGSGCKLSMLLNWHTIDACFLSSFHIQTSFTFFFACLASFFLVISLEFFRRCQRNFHRYLRLKNEFLQEQENAYVMPDEVEEKLLDKGSGEDLRSQKIRPRTVVVVLEQLSRGVIHGCQFTVSYVIMLLFMYSNGYIMMSIIFGAVVGFALFTRDTLYPSAYPGLDEKDNTCC